MLENIKDMVSKAKKHHYAIGQYNINGLLWVQAMLQAAEEEHAPIILAASDRLIDYLGGFKTIVGMVNGLLDEMSISVPVALQLDHGKNVERCKQAIDAGFSSVMIDASHYSLEINIELTRQVVEYAHPRNISVEAEVGTVGGMEDGLVGGIKYADPNECIRFVEETGIDALAAALGSVHGLYQGDPNLAFDLMKQISESTQLPLVLHGASGIPVNQLQQAIELGHAKINVNTETLQAWAKAVRRILKNDEAVYEPRIIMTPGRDAIVTTIKRKMREFNTSFKAEVHM